MASGPIVSISDRGARIRVHATGVGLLLMGSQIEHPRRPVIPTGRAGSFFKKLKEWYRGEF